MKEGLGDQRWVGSAWEGGMQLAQTAHPTPPGRLPATAQTQPRAWFVPVIAVSSAKASCLTDAVNSESGESGRRL